MYLIEEGKAYFVKGDKAYEVSFDLDKKMKIDEEKSIDVKNQPKYSYDVMYRKLNVDYMVEKEKAKQGDNAIINALKNENEALKSEIERLKALIGNKPSEEPKKLNKEGKK